MNLINSYYKVGIYIRLSKEDINKNGVVESESIINQRNLLLSYIEKNNLSLVDEYVDDGYSGTTFDRPNFNRLLKDIESGNINMVITKDLSRLGRDYIQSGYYLEQYFPMKRVRYVSILDNIDTYLDSTNNDIAPFKSLFNDMQSKDTSKKIRSILKNKKQQGKFLGSSPSFGYLKDPNDKHKLIIDYETAPIVRRIFDLALSGKSKDEICSILNNDNIITPIVYKGRKISSRCRCANIWTSSTIHNILSNLMYTGSMVQGRQSKLNYKSKKRIVLDRSNWIIVPNTHEPIVSIEEFELVNKKNTRIKLKTTRDKLLLEGLIYCFECNSLLSVRCDKRNKNNIHYIVNCNKYVRNPRLHLCSSHFIIYERLEKLVLDSVKKYFKLIDRDKIAKLLQNINFSCNLEKINNERISLNNKKNKLLLNLKKIYSDRENMIIGDESYKLLLYNIELELKSINNRLNILDGYKVKHINIPIDGFIKLDRKLLFYIIDRITVSKEKKVIIYYKFNKSL